MQYWLMKAEPDSRVVKGKDVKFSVDDFEKIDITSWEGVRNHSAKLNMKAMKIGDMVLFYHSNCKNPGVAALAEVCKEAYPDHTSWDRAHPYYDPKSDSSKPTWFMVDLKFKQRLQHFVPLSFLRQLKESSYADLIRKCSGSKDDEKPEEDSQGVDGVSYLTEDDFTSIQQMSLLTQGRLSVQPVSEKAFNAIRKLGEMGGWGDVEASKPARKRKRVGDGSGKRAKRGVKANGKKHRKEEMEPESEDGQEEEEEGEDVEAEPIKVEKAKVETVGSRRSTRKK